MGGVPKPSVDFEETVDQPGSKKTLIMSPITIVYKDLEEPNIISLKHLWITPTHLSFLWSGKLDSMGNPKGPSTQ